MKMRMLKLLNKKQLSQKSFQTTKKSTRIVQRTKREFSVKDYLRIFLLLRRNWQMQEIISEPNASL